MVAVDLMVFCAQCFLIFLMPVVQYQYSLDFEQWNTVPGGNSYKNFLRIALNDILDSKINILKVTPVMSLQPLVLKNTPESLRLDGRTDQLA